MLVKTDASTLIDTVRFVSLFSQNAAEQTVKTTRDDKGSEFPKLVDNNYVYKTSLKAVKLKDGAIVGEDRSISLALKEQVDLVSGVQYVLDGEVSLVHYVNSQNRLGVSITADRVVAVK